MKLRSRTFFIAALVPVIVGLPARLSARKPAKAIVRGVVSDPSTAPVSNTEVRLANDGREIVMHTKSDGSYEAKIEPGVYTLRVKYPGFCEGLRGEMSARAGDEIRFDFVLMIAVMADVYTVGPGAHDTRSDVAVGCYRSEELDRPSETSLRPLVLYGTRRTEGDVVRYSSLVRGESDERPAVYMYDRATITANELLYSSKDHSLRAIGRAGWRDGDKVQGAPEIDVSFPNGEAQIKLVD